MWYEFLLLVFFFFFTYCLLILILNRLWQLEDVEIGVSDYVQRSGKTSFLTTWEEMGSANELQETFSLPAIRSLEEAVRNIISFLGLQPCEWSDKVPDGKSSHTLLLSGIFLSIKYS